jgi:riboflavin kinase/FMN adenylyltransferase
VIKTFRLADIKAQLHDPESGGSVVSIGMFDGIHLGHQEILKSNVQRARERGARATVITFRSHPKRLLLGRAPRTLTTLEHRLELFERYGMEHVLALAFDEGLRSMDALDFVREVCVEALGVRHFVLGFDSKFGHDREGTAELLRERGFEVEVVPKITVRGRAVSSTVIREAVELGDLESARAMLGREVCVFGRVVHGAHLGRELGFPTANLDLHHELHPPPGVYACRARLVQRERQESIGGACNIGFRPTVTPEPSPRPIIEVHLLDFDGDLYGERMELEFVRRLRGEKRFADLEELKAQIALDTQAAREALAPLGG